MKKLTVLAGLLAVLAPTLSGAAAPELDPTLKAEVAQLIGSYRKNKTDTVAALKLKYPDAQEPGKAAGLKMCLAYLDDNNEKKATRCLAEVLSR